MAKYNKSDILGFETDTVWGLGCHPFNFDSVQKIYEFKNREKDKPLILMSDKMENLKPFILDVPDYALKLAEEFFPGRVTLIFKKSEFCPDFITAYKDTVGVRIPDHKGFYGIAQNFEGGVLATTSLNISNEPPCKNFEEAYQKFGSKIKIIKPQWDEKPKGTASTVVLCTGIKPVVLRQGDIFID